MKGCNANLFLGLEIDILNVMQLLKGIRVIAVNAGPRKGWNTDTLINEAVKGVWGCTDHG